MRLMLAVVTSALLASAASAQSIAPELQSRSGVVTYAPEMPIAPAIASPSPIASAGVDRGELGPQSIAAPSASAPVLAARPTAEAPSSSPIAAAGEEKLQTARRSRVAAERQEPKRYSGRSEAQSTQRNRPVVSTIREFGRFWPPVF
jgi:hypothetical protein